MAAGNFILTRQPRLAWHLGLLPPSSKGQDDKQELLCSTLNRLYFTEWSSCSFRDYPTPWNFTVRISMCKLQESPAIRERSTHRGYSASLFLAYEVNYKLKISKKSEFYFFFYWFLSNTSYFIPRFLFLLISIYWISSMDRCLTDSFTVIFHVLPYCTLPCLEHVHHRKNHSYNKGIK